MRSSSSIILLSPDSIFFFFFFFFFFFPFPLSVGSIFKSKSKKVNTDMVDENEKLLEEIQVFKDQERQAQEQMDGLKKTVRQLMESTEKAEREAKEHRLKATELERQLLRVKGDNHDKEDKFKSVERDASGSPILKRSPQDEALLKEKDKEIAKLKAALESETEGHTKASTALQQQIEELEAAAKVSTTSLADKTRECQDLRAAKDQDEIELRKREELIENLKQEKAEIADEKKQLKESVESLQQALEKSQNSVLEQKGGDERIAEVVTDLRAQLEAQAKVVEEKTAIIEQGKTSLHDVRTQLSEKTEELRQAQAAAQKLRDDHKQEVEQLKEQHAKKVASQEQGLAAKEAEVAKAKEGAASLDKTLQEVNNQLAVARRALEEREAEHLAEDDTVKKLHQQLELLESEHQLLQSETTTLQEKEVLRNQQIQELRAALQKETAEKEELSKGTARTSELDKEVAQLKTQVVALDAQARDLLQQKEAEKQQADKELAKTKEALNTAVLELKNTERIHNDQVTQLQKAAKEREKFLKEDIDKAQEVSKKDTENFSQKLKEALEERLKLQGRIETLEKDLKNKDNVTEMAVLEVRKEVTAKNGEINELVKSVQTKETLVYELQTKLQETEANLKESIETGERQTHESQEKIEGLEEKVRVLDQKLLQRNTVIKEDKLKMEQMETRIAELEETKKRIGDDLDDLRRQENQAAEALQELQTKVAALEAEAKANHDEIRQLKEILQEKQQQIEILDQSREEKEQTLKIVERTKSAMIKDLQKQLIQEKRASTGMSLGGSDFSSQPISRQTSMISVRISNPSEFNQPISRQASSASMRSVPMSPMEPPVDQRTLHDENAVLINKVAELQSEKWRLEDELRRAREKLQLAQRQAPTAESAEANFKSLSKRPKVTWLFLFVSGDPLG